MAIDNTGISSLDAGALDITYSGDEGPKSPKQIAGGEYNRVLELLEKVREDIPLSEEEKMELQGLIRTLTAKGINVEALMGGDTRMASADPILQDEYDKYVFELKEIHPEAVPMSIEEFKQQAISGMASGGIARLGYDMGGNIRQQPHQPSDLLVRNTLSGERPRYQPPGQPETGRHYGYGDPSRPYGGPGPDPTPKPPGEKGGPGYISPEDLITLQKQVEDFIPGVKKEPFWDRVTSAPTDYRRKFFTKRITDKRKALMDKYSLTPQLAQQIIDMLDEDEGITVDKLRALDFGEGISPFGIIDQPHYKKGLSDLERIQRTPDLTSNPIGLLGVAQDKMIPEFNQLVSTATRIKDLESVLGTEAFKTGKGLQSEIDKYLDTANPFRHGDPSDRGDTYIPPHLREQVAAPVVDETETETAEWEAPEIPTERLRLYSADGGRIPAAYGGIMGDDGRRAYGLGSIFKKAARAIKKVVKSPIGKMALMGLGGYYLGGGSGLWGKQMFGSTGFGSTGFGALAKKWGAKALLNKGETAFSLANLNPWKAGIAAASLYPLLKGQDDDDDDFTQTDLYKRWLEQKQAADIQFAPVGDPANWQRQKLYADGGRIGYAGGGYYDEDEEENHRAAALAAMYRSKAQGGRIGYADAGSVAREGRGLDFVDKIYSDEARALAGNIPEIRKGSQYAPTLFEERTDAGEWKYPGEPREGQEYLTSTLQGANTILDEMEIKKQRLKELAEEKGLDFNDIFKMELDRIYDIEGPATKDITKIKDRQRILEDMEFKLKETNIYDKFFKKAQGGRIGAQEGGLMDLGGMEKDYRQDGGFVPLGGEERADDVPARLSKNEFVFTADAVRAAGGGDIDAGAEVMENVMENLEQGGQVSEESQGLEGARNMFATAQRLEGVL